MISGIFFHCSIKFFRANRPMRFLTLAVLVLLSASIPAGAQKVSKETIRFQDKDRAYYLFVQA
jgi:hypothetical protein